MIDHPWVEIEDALLTLRFPAEPQLSEIEAFGSATHAHYRTNDRPFVWVVDGSNITTQGVRHRKAMAEVLKRDEEHLRAHCRGMALVVPSAMIRGAAQAVLWLASPDYQCRFFSDEGSARAWAFEALSGA